MKKLLYILMLAAFSMSALFSAEAEKVSDKPARKAPDWLMKSIICQVPPILLLETFSDYK